VDSKQCGVPHESEHHQTSPLADLPLTSGKTLGFQILCCEISQGTAPC